MKSHQAWVRSLVLVALAMSLVVGCKDKKSNDDPEKAEPRQGHETPEEGAVTGEEVASEPNVATADARSNTAKADAGSNAAKADAGSNAASEEAETIDAGSANSGAANTEPTPIAADTPALTKPLSDAHLDDLGPECRAWKVELDAACADAASKPERTKLCSKWIMDFNMIGRLAGHPVKKGPSPVSEMQCQGQREAMATVVADW